MESKKTKQANVDRLRLPITLMGVLFAGSIVLASFTYTTGIEREKTAKTDENLANITFLEEIVRPETQPEPPQIQTVLPPDEFTRPDSNTQLEPPKIILIAPPKIKHDTTIVVVDPPIIDFPDTEARFPGGAAAMQQWIVEHVNYPQTSVQINEQGKVYLSFVVETDGSISVIDIERGVSPDIDREAKRLVRNMPNWIPGEAKGKKARTRCRLPINFTLN